MSASTIHSLIHLGLIVAANIRQAAKYVPAEGFGDFGLAKRPFRLVFSTKLENVTVPGSRYRYNGTRYGDSVYCGTETKEEGKGKECEVPEGPSFISPFAPHSSLPA